MVGAVTGAETDANRNAVTVAERPPRDTPISAPIDPPRHTPVGPPVDPPRTPVRPPLDPPFAAVYALADIAPLADALLRTDFVRIEVENAGPILLSGVSRNGKRQTQEQCGRCRSC